MFRKTHLFFIIKFRCCYSFSSSLSSACTWFGGSLWFACISRERSWQKRTYAAYDNAYTWSIVFWFSWSDPRSRFPCTLNTMLCVSIPVIRPTNKRFSFHHVWTLLQVDTIDYDNWEMHETKPLMKNSLVLLQYIAQYEMLTIIKLYMYYKIRRFYWILK